MTIRIRRHTGQVVSAERIAALLTHSLLTPTRDDAPEVKATKPGTGWMRWVDSQIGLPTTTLE
ncbi:MAG: hypothetical protein R3C68_06685 [Myxococcota bacterium]